MSSTAHRERFFATCAPGLEPLLHAEVRELGLSKVERQVGGVYFEGTLYDALRANLWLRTAIRVLMRVARFEARDADMLYAGARGVEWERFVRPDGTLIVDAHTALSELDHSLFIEQRVKDAICDHLRDKHGTRPTVAKEDAELGVYAHVFRDRCTLLVDTSGESLHKRGWRTFQGRAPLAETFAAALVQVARWDQRAPLLDPFCGSGTVLIEAGLIARNMAPGLFRERFGVERWPGHDARLGAKLRADARAAVKTSKARLIGRDIDAKMLEGARENAAAAGLEGALELEQGNALDFTPRKGWGAWLASNPPWGERIGDTRDAARLYRDFGVWLRERCAGFHVALLVPTGAIAHELGLKGAESTRVLNGGIECSILRAEIGDPS
ncbi:MAG: RNA methyltransferase [Planctomycetes bacterium]|nr:RNA methyltransferase [Planctomycetota bacterium]